MIEDHPQWATISDEEDDKHSDSETDDYSDDNDSEYEYDEDWSLANEYIVYTLTSNLQQASFKSKLMSTFMIVL